MDPAGFCTQSRLVIVAGKGGVGKTTVTAALARMASRAGLSTLIVEVEGKSGLTAAFGARPLGYQESVLLPARPPDGDSGWTRQCAERAQQSTHCRVLHESLCSSASAHLGARKRAQCSPLLARRANHNFLPVSWARALAVANMMT